MQQTNHLSNILENELGVDSRYRHAPKHVTPGEPIETAGTILKWYGLHPEDRHVPDEITQLARSYLLKNNLEARGFGFVILHRCGNDFYFLIVNTWRSNNELWETVFYKNGDAMDDFALFPRERIHKPTFCVWELVPLWHEQQSWERFLNSAGNEGAAQTWLDELYSGPA